MKTYQEMAESVFRKGDLILEQRRKRRKKIIMCSALSASGLCASIAILMNCSFSDRLNNDIINPKTSDKKLVANIDDQNLPDDSSSSGKKDIDSGKMNNFDPPKKNETNDQHSGENSGLNSSTVKTTDASEKQPAASEPENTNDNDQKEEQKNEAEKENKELITETPPEVQSSGSDVSEQGSQSYVEVPDMKQSSIKKFTAFVTAMTLTAGQNYIISYAENSQPEVYDELKVLANIEDNAQNYDFDNNKTVDIYDAYAMNIFVKNREELPEGYSDKIEKYGDINGDGDINSKDIDIFTPYCCFKLENLPDKIDFEYGNEEDSTAFYRVIREFDTYGAEYSEKYNHHRYSVFSESVSSGSISLDVNGDMTADLSDLYDIWLFDTYYNTEFWTKINLPDTDRERIAEKCSALYENKERFISRDTTFLKIIAQYILTNNDVTVKDLNIENYTEIYGELTYECLDEYGEDMEVHNVCDEFLFELESWSLIFLNIEDDYEHIELVTSDGFVFTKYSDHAVLTSCTCSSDTVVIPSEIDGLKVTEIGSNSFEKCNNIETVVIPDTVTVISGAFGRTSLRSIDIPDSVKVIESGAFEYCENLEEVTGGKNVEAVGKDVFICTPWLENQKKQSCFVCLGDVLIDVSACNENEVVVPDGIKSIGSGVLGANKNITSFVIPEGVTRICDGAFAFCSNLENIVIPDSVQYLGKNILLYCEKIESVHIPSGLTEIGSLTFCSSYLKSVDIPEGVTEICENAFRDSIYLKEINIPDTVNTIGLNAFFNTQWLADRSAENPLVMFKNNIISGYACTGNVIIPDGVEKIDGFVFACSTATSIFVPDSVKRIETRAFSGADNLQLLRLPEDLEYIGKNIVTSPKCDIVHTSMEEYDPDTYLANINSNPSKAYGVNYSENEKSSGICGDIDMNGIADLSDLTCLSLYLLGSRNLSGAQLANADVDHDGIVSITDLPRFKQYISKDISSLD